MRTLFLIFTLAHTVGCVDAVHASGTDQASPVRTVDIDGLARAQAAGPVQLIDVRTPAEFAAGHVPGARNLPLSELAARLSELPEGGEVHVICQSGARSSRAAALISTTGRAAVNVSGGTSAWRGAGRAVEVGPG